MALAWQPSFDSGLLGTLFSRNKTVIRGGYWHFYDRLNGVQTAIDTLQALGFAQSLLCLGPSLNSGAAIDCRGNSGTTPSTAFRVGIDGSKITLPNIPASITPPGSGRPGQSPCARRQHRLRSQFPSGRSAVDAGFA